jgi:hypothetical protein
MCPIFIHFLMENKSPAHFYHGSGRRGSRSLAWHLGACQAQIPNRDVLVRAPQPGQRGKPTLNIHGGVGPPPLGARRGSILGPQPET